MLSVPFFIQNPYKSSLLPPKPSVQDDKRQGGERKEFDEGEESSEAIVVE